MTVLRAWRVVAARIGSTALALALTLSGCGDRRRDDGLAPEERTSPDLAGVPTPRARELLADLRAGGARADRAVFHIDRLSEKQVLGEAEGEVIIRVLPELAAPGAEEADDPQTGVLHALGQNLYFSWLPALEEIAAELRTPARLALMNVLAGIDDERCVVAFVRLLDRFPSPIPDRAFDALLDAPHQGAALFPALLALLDHQPTLITHILYAATRYVDDDALPAGVLHEHGDELLATYDATLAIVAPAQRAHGIGWRFADDYREARNDLGILLDLFGALPAALVVGRLAAAMELRDPLLVRFAIESWLDHGRSPPPAAIERVCASPETLASLWRELAHRERLDLIPARWHTQEALASSALAWWLAFYSDHGRAPDQLELLERVTFDAGPPDGLVDIYVFRFRSGDGPWLAGQAGNFLRRDGLTAAEHGGTGSDLTEVGRRRATDIVDPVAARASWIAYRDGEPAPEAADAGPPPAP